MIRLPLSAIQAFAAVAPFMAKTDDNYALTGVLLDPSTGLLQATDRHAVARYHLDVTGEHALDAGPDHPALWIPGELVDWIARQTPWRPKKEASPEWWALHEIWITAWTDAAKVHGVHAAIVRPNGQQVEGRDVAITATVAGELAAKFVPTTFDWAQRFPNVAPEFQAQVDAPVLPASTVDLWTVEKVAFWARRWLAQGPGKHPKMPPMSIYARTTNAGHRTVIDVGPLVVVALPEGRILK